MCMNVRSFLESLLGRAPHIPEEIDATVEPLIATTPLEVGRTLTAWLYAGKTASLWARMSPEMRKVFGKQRKLTEFSAKVCRFTGIEQTPYAEWVALANDIDVYTRITFFTETSEFMVVEWSFNQERVIEGLMVSPMRRGAPSRYNEYSTQAVMSLPFGGEWYVFWGGRFVESNYHAEATDQAFAMDFLIIRDRRSHTGDGKRNEDYFCFGEPILAPGDGMVVASENSLLDQPPGVMNPSQPLGNYVIIDHHTGEFSFLAHLQQGSVTVRPGMQVRRGDVIGKCGNSGNSSEPHLHYHLQNTATFGKGEGMPVQFADFDVNGARVRRGEVQRGQVVRNAIVPAVKTSE